MKLKMFVLGMKKHIQFGNLGEKLMFIYQTKKLYNEDGDGPFDALVVTNGEQGEKPAEADRRAGKDRQDLPESTGRGQREIRGQR